MSCTCSIWCDGVQFDCQRVVGLSVMFQSVAVAATPIKEPFATEHGSVRQVQPQIFSHLTLLTLPATGNKGTQALVMLNPAVLHSLTEALKCILPLTHTYRHTEVTQFTFWLQTGWVKSDKCKNALFLKNTEKKCILRFKKWCIIEVSKLFW